VTKKPLEVAWLGQGNVEYWVAKIQPGKMLYEMEGITEAEAREAFKLAAAKLPVRPPSFSGRFCNENCRLHQGLACQVPEELKDELAALRKEQFNLRMQPRSAS